MDWKESNKGNEVELMTAATTVQKWGNSLGVRIPKDIAERIKIHQGSEIEMSVMENEDKIILMPKKPQIEYSLEDLLAQCKPENRHEEIDFGVEGKELI